MGCSCLSVAHGDVTEQLNECKRDPVTGSTLFQTVRPIRNVRNDGVITHIRCRLHFKVWTNLWCIDAPTVTETLASLFRSERTTTAGLKHNTCGYFQAEIELRIIQSQKFVHQISITMMALCWIMLDSNGNEPAVTNCKCRFKLHLMLPPSVLYFFYSVSHARDRGC